MTKQEKTAREKLKKLSLEKLVQQFELTTNLPATIEVAMVRGWLMDAIEEKNEKGFAEWIENSDDDNVRQYVL